MTKYAINTGIGFFVVEAQTPSEARYFLVREFRVRYPMTCKLATDADVEHVRAYGQDVFVVPGAERREGWPTYRWDVQWST